MLAQECNHILFLELARAGACIIILAMCGGTTGTVAAKVVLELVTFSGVKMTRRVFIAVVLSPGWIIIIKIRTLTVGIFSRLDTILRTMVIPTERLCPPGEVCSAGIRDDGHRARTLDIYLPCRKSHPLRFDCSAVYFVITKP